MNHKFPSEVADALKAYVYVYVDPRDNKPFYIGHGIGNRAFSHLDEQAETRKCERIQQIRRAGKEPVIEVLRYGLTDEQAALVEASTIDLLGLGALTNQVRGDHSDSFGRVSVTDLMISLAAREVEITQPVILITINKLYRSDMTELELFEATRGIWVLDPQRASNAIFAFAVYQGIVREVYRVTKWQPAGTDRYTTRDDTKFRTSGRWEFDGTRAETESRNLYLHTTVRRYVGQNPIRYINF